MPAHRERSHDAFGFDEHGSLRVDSNDVELHKQQMATSLHAFRAFAIFAYSSLFDSPNDVIDLQSEEAREQRQARRLALMPVFKEMARGDLGRVE